MFLVETFDLTRKFNDIVAVNKVNLKIKKGEIFGILGPNGAGKTTLISMLCTLLQPTEGTAKVNGFDIVDERDNVRKSIGIVFQDPSLDNRLTALENLELHAGLYGINGNERMKRINEVLEMVSLTERANDIVRYYSGGMKRRLEIARGLIHYPEILFLDEPTIGLDPKTRKHIWEYIKKLSKKENITILVTTHYMEEAEFLCDRVAIMDHGKIIALGTPNDLKKNLEGDIVVIKTEQPEKFKEKLKKTNSFKKLHLIEDSIHITIKNSDKFIPKIFDIARKNKIKINSININKPSLGDVFLYYTGREMRDETNNGKDIMKRRFVRR